MRPFRFCCLCCFESLGFSPFELISGHEVKGPLHLFKEQVIESTSTGDVPQYVSSFRTRLRSACEVTGKNLVRAKARMKARYDKKAVRRTFDRGDLVLMLVTGLCDQLEPGFASPYRVLKKVGDPNYILSTPERRSKTRRDCHINALKAYEGREVAVCCVVPDDVEEEELSSCYPEMSSPPPDIVSARFYNTQA